MAKSEVTHHSGTTLPETLIEMLNVYGCTDGEYVVAAYALRQIIDGQGLLEQLRQLYDSGPIWDGNVISKADRDQLLRWGLATKVCVEGEDGYQACTYRGRSVLKAIDKADF